MVAAGRELVAKLCRFGGGKPKRTINAWRMSKESTIGTESSSKNKTRFCAAAASTEPLDLQLQGCYAPGPRYLTIPPLGARDAIVGYLEMPDYRCVIPLIDSVRQAGAFVVNLTLTLDYLGKTLEPGAWSGPGIPLRLGQIFSQNQKEMDFVSLAECALDGADLAAFVGRLPKAMPSIFLRYGQATSQRKPRGPVWRWCDEMRQKEYDGISNRSVEINREEDQNPIQKFEDGEFDSDSDNDLRNAFYRDFLTIQAPSTSLSPAPSTSLSPAPSRWLSLSREDDPYPRRKGGEGDQVDID
ncbi:hypothetical protein B0T26DRAFT_677189 [Lasiosphaeria miniovina]|uniref:Uncharacterized protein n=1 Tax=Lasiosphaeria miniovina TaxID=1954250 RepID=A0AA40ABD9_9PEZI|nr:uncharacterized protein B0T26DRAFT_677189 [Lasiosphaeria miniovina]KAK0712769.1 hypothetical protein B0T26DRAFT_677189 [Lasiosphaeria miniovina]